MKALIVFQSKTGHTEQAARDIARGLEQEGSECVLADAGSGRGVPDPSDFEVLVIGTPTYGNKRYRLPGGHVKTFLDSIPDGGLAGKPCGAFTVNAAMGGKTLSGPKPGAGTGTQGRLGGSRRPRRARRSPPEFVERSRCIRGGRQGMRGVRSQDRALGLKQWRSPRRLFDRKEVA